MLLCSRSKDCLKPENCTLVNVSSGVPPTEETSGKTVYWYTFQSLCGEFKHLETYSAVLATRFRLLNRLSIHLKESRTFQRKLCSIPIKFLQTNHICKLPPTWFLRFLYYDVLNICRMKFSVHLASQNSKTFTDWVEWNISTISCYFALESTIKDTCIIFDQNISFFNYQRAAEFIFTL